MVLLRWNLRGYFLFLLKHYLHTFKMRNTIRANEPEEPILPEQRFIQLSRVICLSFRTDVCLIITLNFNESSLIHERYILYITNHDAYSQHQCYSKHYIFNLSCVKSIKTEDESDIKPGILNVYCCIDVWKSPENTTN